MGRRGTSAAGEPPSTRATPVVVQVIDSQSVAVDAARIRSVAARAAQAEGAWGEISVSLVEPDRIAELNARYMGKSGPTDVLAFPIDGKADAEFSSTAPAPMIGDLVVCPEMAANQAPGDVDAELDLLVTHGVLHLLGYDHDTEAAAEIMRQREFDLIGRSGAQA
ncbi:MAG: rRNA maturation RNase YbeY [Actinomycetota bacterium]